MEVKGGCFDIDVGVAGIGVAGIGVAGIGVAGIVVVLDVLVSGGTLGVLSTYLDRGLRCCQFY